MSVRFPLSCTRQCAYVQMFLPFYYPFCLLARVFPVIVPWHLPAAINMKIVCNRRDAKRVLWLTKVSIIWLGGNLRAENNRIGQRLGRSLLVRFLFWPCFRPRPSYCDILLMLQNFAIKCALGRLGHVSQDRNPLKIVLGMCAGRPL